MSSSRDSPGESQDPRQGSTKGRKNSRNQSEDDGSSTKTTRKGNLKSLPQSTDKHSENATKSLQNASFSKPQPKVSFVEADEMYREPVTKYKSCRKTESKFKTATRKLQRLLLKPFDYDANLS